MTNPQTSTINSTSSEPQSDLNRLTLPTDHGTLATCDEIERNLRLFHDGSSVLHLIALQCRRPGLQVPCQFGGYFDGHHLSEMAQAAIDLSPHSKGVYFALNPVHQDCLAKLCNRTDRLGNSQSVTLRDISRRRWMYLDFDPQHPAGISGIAATDDERHYAFNAAIQVAADLKIAGWPHPIVGDTGNGFHLYYRLDLPVESKLVQEFTVACSAQYSTPNVKVDNSVHNANRITRVYGTQNRKGDPLPGRPHRYSRILYCLSDPYVVDEQQLQTAIESLRRHIATSQTTIEVDEREDKNRPSDNLARPIDESNREQSPVHSEVLRRAAAYVATMKPAIQGQCGDHQTYTAACRLAVGFDLTPQQALPLLLEYNARCQPPWTESDLIRKLERARQAGRAEEFGKLLRADVATSSRETTPQLSLPELPGPRFPVPVPDFVPVPPIWIDYELGAPLLASRRGRPRRDFATTITWILIWQSLDQARIPPIVPDQLFKYCLYGPDGQNGWRNTLLPQERRSLRPMERIAGCIEANQAVIDQLTPVLQLIAEQERGGGQPSDEQVSIIERFKRAVHENQHFATRIIFHQCPSDCPFHDSFIAHQHVVSPLVNNVFNSGFLEFISCDGEYQRIDLDRVVEGKRLLDELRKHGRFRYAYLPALIFGDRCGFSRRQIRLIQTLVFETTRLPNKRPNKRLGKGIRSGQHVTALVRGANVPARTGQGTIRCPLLDPNNEYVQFNGNLRKRLGSGYLIAGDRSQPSRNQGGWLGRVGYPMSTDRSIERIRPFVRTFANDLAALSETLGLVVGSVHKNQTWHSIAEIVRVAELGSDTELRRFLDAPLRIYGPSDYLTRWRHLFAEKLGFSFIPGGKWNEPANSNDVAINDLPSMEMIRRELKRLNIQQKVLAADIGWSESRVSRQLSGKCKSSQAFISTVANYLLQLRS